MTERQLDPDQTRQDVKRRARVEGLPLALETAFAICRDKTAPPSARAGAIAAIIKLAGTDEDDEALGGKELHEMDGQELPRYLARLRAQAAAAERSAAERSLEAESDNDQVETEPEDDAFG